MKWSRIQFWLQEKLVCTKQELHAFFLICTLIVAAQVIRVVRVNRILFDDAYYAEADSLFQVLTARADSLDAVDTLYTSSFVADFNRVSMVDSYKEIGLFIIEDTLKGPVVSFPININSASQTDLQALPRIGPSLAKRIVDFRDERRFKSKTDLLNVRGIGTKTLEGLSDLITTQDSVMVTQTDSLHSES